MSFIPVAMYFAGGAVLGLTGWLLNGVLDEFVSAGVSQTGTVYDFVFYVWTAVFVIYWVFGGIWVVRKYNEREYMGGM